MRTGKPKGRPVGSKDTIDRSELPLKDRLKICKDLIKDSSLSSKERLDAIRLYSELQGDKKQDGYEKVKVIFEVVPDRNIPPEFNGTAINRQQNEPQQPVAPLIDTNTVDKPVPTIVVPEAIKEEPLIPPVLPLQIVKTDDELWQDTLSERDKSIKDRQDKFIDGN